MPGVGPVTVLRALQEGLSDVTRRVPHEVWRDAELRASECVGRARTAGAQLLILGEAAYPDALLSLPDPPVVLYAMGNLACLALPAVGLVGSRKATSYGLRVTRGIVNGLPTPQVAVVSGMALGIDAEAHNAALDRGTPTIAVLGTGVDVPYPPRHQALHARIAAHGLVLAEAPPGTTATPGSFPRRNRILAALSDVLVVTEANERSGALISARLAIQMNRITGAVPGPVDVASSAGTNALLRDGAHVVTGSADVRALLHLTSRGRALGRSTDTGVPASHQPGGRTSESSECSVDSAGSIAAQPADGAASVVERTVLNTLALGPRLPDELLLAAGASAREVSVILTQLTLRGVTATDAAGMVYLLNRG